MTMLAPPPMPAAVPVPPDAPSRLPEIRSERVLLKNISWATYTALLADVGDGAAHLTYDNGLLEIEMPGWLHELIAALSGELVTATLKRRRITYIPGKSTTWRQIGAARGLEADECYYVQSTPLIRGKLQLDLAVDPPPDLAIEVEVESPLLDTVAVYRGLGVPELWRLREDASCEMMQLDAAGHYQPIAVSAAVPPLTPAVLSRYVQVLIGSDFAEAVARFEGEFLPTLGG